MSSINSGCQSKVKRQRMKLRWNKIRRCQSRLYRKKLSSNKEWAMSPTRPRLWSSNSNSHPKITAKAVKTNKKMSKFTARNKLLRETNQRLRLQTKMEMMRCLQTTSTRLFCSRLTTSSTITNTTRLKWTNFYKSLSSSSRCTSSSSNHQRKPRPRRNRNRWTANFSRSKRRWLNTSSESTIYFRRRLFTSSRLWRCSNRVKNSKEWWDISRTGERRLRTRVNGNSSSNNSSLTARHRSWKIIRCKDSMVAHRRRKRWTPITCSNINNKCSTNSNIISRMGTKTKTNNSWNKIPRLSNSSSNKLLSTHSWTTRSLTRRQNDFKSLC